MCGALNFWREGKQNGCLSTEESAVESPQKVLGELPQEMKLDDRGDAGVPNCLILFFNRVRNKFYMHRRGGAANSGSLPECLAELPGTPTASQKNGGKLPMNHAVRSSLGVMVF